MDDSPDIFGDQHRDEDEPKPSAAELEAAGQSALFGFDEPAAPKAEMPIAEPEQAAADTPPWAQDPQPAPPPVEALAPVATPMVAPASSETTPAAPTAAVSAAAAAAAAAVPAPTAPAAQPYRVLARKYRPQTFSELIGQDAMVQTLGNAIKRDRLAHAFLMTGVRGVGKTSTARLIAKALNCIGLDGQGGPTIDPCGRCEPCVAIAEGRHIDVIEMDAASHTGVDDVRDIIEAVRYAAVSARYKIYIIDEVHMLSRNAFNALLKTLEEPPAHVKFLFATTEVNKLPVTVLSRCQRFDLKRISPRLLVDHFASICTQEGIAAELEALAMIASAAEGSVRDGLSILDQAIAHADLDTDGTVRAAQVRDMLGLSDKSAQRNLLSMLLAGDGRALLEIVDHQFALGVEPLAMLRGLMEMVHHITVAQVGGGPVEAASEEERDAIEAWRGSLKAGQLHRLWQLLLKGHDEVRAAPDPLIAAQMALLRCMHAVDMPDPGTLARKLEELASRPVTVAPAAVGGAPSSENASAVGVPVPQLRWDELVTQIEADGEVHLANKMRLQVRVVELSSGKLLYSQPAEFREDIAAELRAGLAKLTGDRWQVEKVTGQGAPTLYEQQAAAEKSAEEERRTDPLVAATFAAFPEAHFVEQSDLPRRAGGASY